MQTEHLKVTGMTCNGCTTKVATALRAINGVNDVQVSFPVPRRRYSSMRRSPRLRNSNPPYKALASLWIRTSPFNAMPPSMAVAVSTRRHTQQDAATRYGKSDNGVASDARRAQ